MNQTFQEKLEHLKKNSQVTQEMQEKIEKGFKMLKDQGVLKNAKKAGQFPDFKLYERDGSIIDNSAIQNKTVIFSFFRGSWCPYCKLEINEYEALSDKFKELGVEIYSVSPEKIDFINKSVLSSDVIKNVHVVEDKSNNLAKALGIKFQLDPETSKIYKGFKIDLLTTQENGSEDSLPIPATYVVKNNEIVAFSANEDYSKREDPEKILNLIKKMM